MISVYNAAGQSIFFSKYLFVDGKPDSHFTDKHYYENDVVKYTFNYNKDGTCFVVMDEQEHHADIYGFEIGTSNTGFTWKGFEYYEFEDLIVPEQYDKYSGYLTTSELQIWLWIEQTRHLRFLLLLFTAEENSLKFSFHNRL